MKKDTVELHKTEGPDGRTIWAVTLTTITGPTQGMAQVLGRTYDLGFALKAAGAAVHQYKAKRGPTLARKERNAAARAKNQVLRDLCGTSAAAARRDMGM